MYKLKSIARRSSVLGSAFAVLAAAVIPAVPAFADALNPLTDRSLTLSSSAPGWDDKDGSGNSTYAPPNSGANGRKSGNTFTFKTSTDTTVLASNKKVKKITFQYCTTPAGNCMAPGNNPWTGTVNVDQDRLVNGVTGTYDAYKSDLNVVTASPSEVSSVIGANISSSTGATTSIPSASGTGSNFAVVYNNGGTWAQSTGWSMTAGVSQTYNGSAGSKLAGTSTGTNNLITLTNSATEDFTAGQEMKIVFFATNTNYITNPGADEFFVRINMINDDDEVIDGGVTVANVMNQSIQIMTKVLETMDFSVGTVDPYTLASTGSAGSQLDDAAGIVRHGTCDPIVKSMDKSVTDADPTQANTLQLGNANGEFSLETDKTYSTHSYWRLSSNSSGGATVYYSGVTLSNTVGDKIDAIGGTATAPQPGMEQFGLALDNKLDEDGGTAGVQSPNGLVSYAKERDTSYVFQNGDDNAVSGIDASVEVDLDPDHTAPYVLNPSYHAPGLHSMEPTTNYGGGTGVVNTKDSHYGASLTTSFAFDETSNQIPVALAQTTNVAGEVVDCVSAKMRYIANIASTTPAGIYTTKINYIASPKY